MENVILYLLVNAVVGGGACFFGKRLFYVMLGALVFLGVFNLALSATDGSALSLVLAAVLGVAAALLSRYAYKAGLFVVGFVAGAALGFVVSMFLPQDASGMAGVVAIVAGALAGAAAVRWCDLFVRLSTAYAGASLLASSALAAALAFGELAARAVPGDALATSQALSQYVSGDFTAQHAVPCSSPHWP